MAHAEADIGGQVRRGVEGFLGADAGGGRPHYIADGVAASFPGGQPYFAEQAQHFGGLFQRDVVDLDVFPRGDVAFLQRGVARRDFAEAVQHRGGDDAAGEFDAHHLHIGLALAVHALPEPEGRECGVVHIAGAEAVDFGVKPPDFVLHKRDDARRVGGQGDAGFVD